MLVSCHYNPAFDSIHMRENMLKSLSAPFFPKGLSQTAQQHKLSSRDTNFQMDAVLDRQRPSSADPPVYPIKTTPSSSRPARWRTTIEDTSSLANTDIKPVRRPRSSTLPPGVRGTPSMLWQISTLKDPAVSPSDVSVDSKALLPPIGSERRRASSSDLDAFRDSPSSSSPAIERKPLTALNVNPVSQSPMSSKSREISTWCGNENMVEAEEIEEKVLPVLSPAEFKELLKDTMRKSRYAPPMVSPLNPRRAQAPPKFRTVLPPLKRLRQFRVPLVVDPESEEDQVPPRRVEPSLRKLLLKSFIGRAQEDAMTMFPLFEDEDEVMDISPSCGGDATLADELRTASDDMMIVDGPTFEIIDVGVDDELASVSDNWEERIPESPRLRDADSFDDEYDDFA